MHPDRNEVRLRYPRVTQDFGNRVTLRDACTDPRTPRKMLRERGQFLQHTFRIGLRRREGTFV